MIIASYFLIFRSLHFLGSSIAYIFLILSDCSPICSLDMNDPCKEFHAGGLEGMNEFASPGYPQKYPPSMDCFRVIEAPSGYDVVMHFRDVFQIESTYEESRVGDFSIRSEHCPNDFIEIRDGRYGFSPLIGRFCGMRIPHSEIRAKSGSVWLRFHSDDELEYKGFYADYEFIRSETRTSLSVECTIAQTLSLDGHIESKTMRDFYQRYRNSSSSMDCVWRVEVPDTLQLAFFFENFTMAAPNVCAVNFVEVYAGRTSDVPLRRFCGLTASHIFSSHSVAFVRIFAARNALFAMNVRILFTTFSRNKNCSTSGLFSCGDETCIPASLVCNRNFNCLYHQDEQQCTKTSESISSFFAAGFSRLFITALLLFVAVFLLCLWSLTRCSCLKSRPARCEDFLKELSGIPPPGFSNRDNERQYKNVADQNGNCRRDEKVKVSSKSVNNNDDKSEGNYAAKKSATRTNSNQLLTQVPRGKRQNEMESESADIWRKRPSLRDARETEEEATLSLSWLSTSEPCFSLSQAPPPPMPSPVRVHIRD